MAETPDFLDAILNSIADPVFVKDRQHRWVFMNDAMCRLMGHPRQELLGKTDYDYFPKHQVDVFWEKDELVFNTGQENINEEEFTDADGQVHTIVTKKTLYTDSAGASFIVGIIRDITQVKQLEQKLIESHKMESVGRMAGAIAHDFNNILMIITGYVENLSARFGRTDPELGQDFQEMNFAADRAARLVKQLLVFSRQQVVKARACDLNQTIREMLPMIERTVGVSIKIHMDLESGLPPIMVDSSQINQVILNMALNSRHATPGDGFFDIKTSLVQLTGSSAHSLPAGPYVSLVVSDSGVGISKNILSRIFDPFFTTKPRDQGTGLGLSTVYGIVQQAGGEITVESKEHQGAVFTILLPAAKGVPASGAGAVKSTAFEPAAPSDAGKTILIAEDENTIRKLLKRQLESRGYHVLDGADGRDALQKAAEHQGKIDLIVTDVMMPHVGGFELSRRMKELVPGIQTIFISGFADEVKSKIHETDFFLQKPFQSAELMTLIEQIFFKK